ncbi:selenide, water dikinase SelD [Aeromonas rivipollensis]|uniref:selenide, water dikinase SelD n=1 Tax=Aeromonas rivipollensis TaxID=948519 RepID=UPI00259EE756|nr:selenide, water dikinase SelD [Aeromonas rivipollensis]MDM5083772.1 selenide, water dikinase SelD [Aeromonas rivipollensis]MDM5096150.1 selenide, water dikinase SelD [Aeromonas rivipollensis]MDM5104297.1 selenide, water dikinase SelD [Aeromonas rivipollensis]
MSSIRLTQYSHGAGCGCKISPKVLDTILKSQIPGFDDPTLVVGNSSKDDAAVVDIGNGQGIVSTTDFFMPIVDDPFTFGRIAATNAISDIYAMGGKPIVAIAILGWPINTLAPEIAQQVIDGGRQVCHEAGISLAGGHSIDAPEPIFGLAVTGIVPLDAIKQNDTAKVGDVLYLTKPLGIGILTTAQKKGKLKPEHEQLAPEAMCTLNKIGQQFAALPGVHAMTDVTGFGLAGHLLEMCEGSGVCARLDFKVLPLLDEVDHYLSEGCVPGGTLRNHDSYGHKLDAMSDRTRNILCDPQTSGGLLVAVGQETEAEFLAIAEQAGLRLSPIGRLQALDGARFIEVIQ